MTKLTQMAVIFAALTTSVALVSVEPRGRSAHAKMTNMTREAADELKKVLDETAEEKGPHPLCNETAPCGSYYMLPKRSPAADCAVPVTTEAECRDVDLQLRTKLNLFSPFRAIDWLGGGGPCYQYGRQIRFNRLGVQTVSPGDAYAVCKSTSSPASPPGMAGMAANSATAPSVSAVGDPHMQNILGQRFDLAQPGEHTLLEIPRGASASDALLRVTADAEHEGGACSDMYFKALNITGLWVSAQQKEGYMYTAGAPQPVAGWRTFGKVEVKVAWGRTLGGVEYLNFMVRHLTRVGQDVGGLLGMDDYTQAAKRDPSCGSATLVQLYSAPQEASFAMADM